MNAADDNPDDLLRQVRTQRRRQQAWQREGGARSLARFVGQIGVLGWMIVTPGLIGVFAGRLLDHRFGTGIFWTAPLLMSGIALGCWGAWRWMHQQ